MKANLTSEGKVEQTEVVEMVEVEPSKSISEITVSKSSSHEVELALDICRGEYQLELENYCRTVEDKEIFNFEPELQVTGIVQPSPYQDEAKSGKIGTSCVIENTLSHQIDNDSVDEREDIWADKIVCSLRKDQKTDEIRATTCENDFKLHKLSCSPATHDTKLFDKPANTAVTDDTSSDSRKPFCSPKEGIELEKTANSTPCQEKEIQNKPLRIQVRPVKPLKKTTSPKSAFLFWKYVEANCGIADKAGKSLASKGAFGEGDEENELLLHQKITDFDDDLNLNDSNQSNGSDTDRIDDLETSGFQATLQNLAPRNWKGPDNDKELDSKENADLPNQLSNDTLKPESGESADIDKFDMMFAEMLHQLDDLDKKVHDIEKSCVPKSLSESAAQVLGQEKVVPVRQAGCTSATTKINDTQVSYV